MSSRQAVKTSLYVSITFVSKAIGLTREFLLLAVIGIGAELDSFLFLITIPLIVTTLVASVVYTDTTPLAARAITDGKVDPKVLWQLLVDSIKVGAALMVVASVANLIVTFVFDLQGHETNPRDYWLGIVVASTVLFSVTAEYSSSVITAQGNVRYLVAGNIFISIPPIIALLIFDLTIENYAIVFASSFALRTLYLWACIVHTNDVGTRPPARLSRRVGLVSNGWSVVTAGSGLVAIALSMQLSTLLMRALPEEGSVTLFYYGVKLPQLYLTTVWFVLGSTFFARIQKYEPGRIRAELRRVTSHNAVFLVLAYALVWVFLRFEDRVDAGILEDFQLHQIAVLSLFCLPRMVFVPIVDMAQKALATLGRGSKMAPIAVTIFVANLVATIAAVAFGGVKAVLLTTTAALAIGALVAVRQMSQLTTTSTGPALSATPERTTT